MKEYLFEKEIRLFGLKRSGNSAIISFILGHYEDSEMVYLHNTDFSFRPRSRLVSPFEFHHMLEDKGMDNVRCYLNTTEHNYPASSHFKVISERMADRNYSYNIDSMWYAWYYGFGKKRFSRDRYNIILIRSPHNNLASLLRILYMGRGFQKHLFYNFAEDWLMYAREVLEETDYFGDKIVCKFDDWFSHKSYRQSLSSSLGLKYNNKGVNTVMRSVGSSFDGMRLADKAQEMKVLDRWKKLRDNEEYLDVLNNDEIIEKTKILFDVDLKEILFDK
jgi:hypothetical protein